MPDTRAKKEPRPFTAQQRAQAVLALWTERRRPGELCQELAISFKVLSYWETRALSGMLQALEAPSTREPGPALSPKLERLLARQALKQQGRLAKLEKRLVKLQEKTPPQPKAPPPPSK